MKEEKKVSRKALAVWRIRIGLLAFFPAFITFFFWAPWSVVWQVFTALWVLGVAVMFWIYYPIKYNKLAYLLTGQAFVLHCGVIYTRVKAIYRENIQFATIASGPVQRLLGVCTLYLVSAGGGIHVSCLEQEEAVRLQNLLCPEVAPDAREEGPL